MSKNERKAWPKDCVWSEPENCGFDWDEDLIPSEVDEEIDDLEEIKSYYDDLVEEGILNEDYTINEDYDGDWDEKSEDAFDIALFEPTIGLDYWDEDGFNYEGWQMDLSDHLNELKITVDPKKIDPIDYISRVIGYYFVNEHLVRQSFTRRAFAIEYGISGGRRRFGEKDISAAFAGKFNAGCSEELEFFGDSILNMIVTKEIVNMFSEMNSRSVQAPFQSALDEGELSKLRAKFICKEHLAQRARVLGLDQFILYGTGEQANDSSLEDMMEALIGAVAIDSDWDMDVLGKVVDHLVDLQIDRPNDLLKQSYYEVFNAWHQRHFGSMPEYSVFTNYENGYDAVIRFRVPENELGIEVNQRLTCSGATRSEARNLVARDAYFFVCNHKLWMNLADAHIIPSEMHAINQLQELYQKKYLYEAPVYSFEEGVQEEWYCSCVCCGIFGYGKAGSKTKAKKQAAMMVLTRLGVATR